MRHEADDAKTQTQLQNITDAEAEALIVRSVELFNEVRENWWQSEGREQGRVYPLCLAGIGPYGAYLANGAEYRGRYGVSKEVLRQFHARRMELLWNAGADILLIETQPSLQEALLEADLAEQLGADYWISFTCGDDAHTWEGDDIRDCAKALSENHPHLKMIGVNCVAPHLVSGLIENLKAGCGLPIGVYPNSGETYDPITKTWSGTKDGVRFGDYAYRWMEEGGFRCRRLLPDGGQPHPAGHGGPGTLPEAGISKQLSENLLSGEKGLFRHAEGPGAAPLEAIPGPVFCRLRFNIGPR